MKIKTVVFIIILFHSLPCFSYKLKIIDDVEKAFHVEIILDTTFHGSWELSYERVADTTRIKNYLEILLIEYRKYPAGYLNNAKVNKIIICDNLILSGQKRAAVPDPYEMALYLEIDSYYSKNYLIHVMHHELHHSSEYALYENMYYRWGKWERKNKKGFKYGNGGIAAYQKQNANIDYYSVTHPEEGFLNLYSTMGEEEDRSEVVALMMTDDERKFLLELLKTDRILQKKVKLVIKQLNTVSGTDFISWGNLSFKK